ncbi:exported hypothetical protein [Tenacibaculum litopenaei]|jgi:hypothetical protein
MIKNIRSLSLFLVCLCTITPLANVSAANTSAEVALKAVVSYSLNAPNFSFPLSNSIHTIRQEEEASYTLTDEDYAMVGNGGFSNFDIREGYDEETITARLAKISTILLKRFPQYKSGQKVAVTYNVWMPGDDVMVMNVVHDGEKYVLQKQ